MVYIEAETMKARGVRPPTAGIRCAAGNEGGDTAPALDGMKQIWTRGTDNEGYPINIRLKDTPDATLKRPRNLPRTSFFNLNLKTIVLGLKSI